MRVKIASDSQEMAKLAFEELIDVVANNPNATIGLATGSTPIGLYKLMIEDHENNGTSYKDIQTFNLDEYVGLEKEHPESYISFMKKNLFDHIDINFANVNIPNGLAEDIDKECERYSELLENAKIDIQLLGIGGNGHIAFNEPGTSFDSKTHQTDLTDKTIKDNSRFFDSIEQVPTKALTMGISEIMKAKKILILANGEGKATAIKNMVMGVVGEDCPASVLQNHKNVIVVVDKQAASELLNFSHK